MKKRILAAVLAMLLVFGFTTVSAWAANVSDESSLLTELSAGGTAVLNQNITITQKVTVSQNVTLDLNGFTLTLANGNIDISAGASLTIVDSSRGQSGTISGGGSININGTLNLQSGRIVIEVDNKSAGQFYITGGNCSELYNKGTLHANGGTVCSLTENYGTITVDTGCTPTVFGGDVRNLSGGQIAGGTFDKYVFQDAEDAVISGGTYKGTVTASDGEIKDGAFYGKVYGDDEPGVTVSGGVYYALYTFLTTKINESAYVTITFDSHGGTAIAQKKLLRTTMSEPTPTKAGYIFCGWYREESYKTKFDFATEAVTEDITLHAKWDNCPEHNWADGVCTKCKYECEHSGGTATCIAKAVCEDCKMTYGELGGHSLTHTLAKAATTESAGNREYWYCDVCEKYFSDADAANVITDGKDGVVIPKLPVIIKGDGQAVTVGEKKALEFISDAEYADFIRVEIDGKTVDGSNYTVKSDNTIVTLNADYVATLSAGEHTIGIVSQSGTATAKFTVNKQVEKTNATTDNPTTNDEAKSPQTADNSNITFFLTLLIASSGAVAVITLANKKRKHN